MKETGRKMRERSVENRGEDKEKIMKAGRRHNLVQIANRMKERDDGGVCPAVCFNSWNREVGGGAAGAVVRNVRWERKRRRK